MSATAPVFQANRTSAIVPKEARHKRQIRLVLAAFSEQFVAALVSRLTTYCTLRKSKTVDGGSLRRAAEELIGAGAAELPSGLAEEDLPQTIIYARFKRALAGLRTDASCSSLTSIIGFHFLRYVQDLVDRAYAAQAADPKSVTVRDVIAVLERPGKFSPSGLPTIAYRHDEAIFAADEKKEGAAEAAAAPAAAAPAAEEPEKKAKKAKKAKEAKEANEPAAAVAEPEQQQQEPAKKAPKKRSNAAKEAGAAAAAAAAEAEAPAAKKRRAPAGKKAVSASQ